MTDAAQTAATVSVQPAGGSGRHAHQCYGCGLIWFHPEACQGVEAAHKCPNCGKVQWHKAVLPTAIHQQAAPASKLDTVLGWALIASGLILVGFAVWQYVRTPE